jgi:2'-5' RNA ligase
MVELSSYQFQEVYSELGIDTGELGTVVLQCEQIPVTSVVSKSRKKIKRQLFFSKNPSQKWMQGAVGEKIAHVTLLHGLLSKEYQPQIERVLADWEAPLFVEIEGIGCFDSVSLGEPYSAIVAHIKLTPELLEARARLAFLPHINTFSIYHPHITLAYVRMQYRDKWLGYLQHNLPLIVPVVGIDYGNERSA